MGVVVLGDHHQSGSIFVQPVDDARPDGAANPLNVGASGQQSIHQSLVGVPWTGVHRKTGRFIDDNYVAVLVYEGQRHPLRHHIGYPRRRNGKRNQIPGTNLLGRFGGAPVEKDLALHDQPMQLSPCELGILKGQKLVQPHLSCFDIELSTDIPSSPDRPGHSGLSPGPRSEGLVAPASWFSGRPECCPSSSCDIGGST